MYRLLAVVVSCSITTACSGYSNIVESSSCDTETFCEMQGTIDVESRWQASLRDEDGCVALALPESFFDGNSSINDRDVIVRGRRYPQPDMQDGKSSYYYEIDGIRVNTNLCREVALKVESIEYAGKTVWRTP